MIRELIISCLLSFFRSFFLLCQRFWNWYDAPRISGLPWDYSAKWNCQVPESFEGTNDFSISLVPYLFQRFTKSTKHCCNDFRIARMQVVTTI